MNSWLRDVPEGTEVRARFVHSCIVEVVWGGDDLLFEAQVGFESGRYFNGSLIAADDLPMVKAGARFWLVEERIRPANGRIETWSGLRFQRPGVETAQEAFLAADGEPAP